MGIDADVAKRAAEMYHLGESKLETAKKCTGSRKMYPDCVELCYYAILYGIKAALAVDDALPDSQEDAFAIFKEFHVGSEQFPDECWKRLLAVLVLHEECVEKGYIPEVREVETQVESAEYMLLLTNMFLGGKGVAL